MISDFIVTAVTSVWIFKTLSKYVYFYLLIIDGKKQYFSAYNAFLF